MLHAVYREDGSIWQATKVYDQPDYGKMLAEHAMPYVAVNSPTLISDEDWYVKTSTEELCERPFMSMIEVGRSVIRSGPGDSCVAKNIPPNAKVTVKMHDGTVVYEPFILDGHELEISIPVPCTYRVSIDLWPYRTFTYDIEAVA